jgi:ClpP class serine protease
VAQGRVWTGAAALQRKLVDSLGGVRHAAALAAQAAGIPEGEQYAVVEVTRGRANPLKLLSG